MFAVPRCCRSKKSILRPAPDFLNAIEPAASRRDDYAGQLGTKP
jgi:hypothetical protein